MLSAALRMRVVPATFATARGRGEEGSREEGGGEEGGGKREEGEGGGKREGRLQTRTKRRGKESVEIQLERVERKFFFFSFFGLELTKNPCGFCLCSCAVFPHGLQHWPVSREPAGLS